MKYLHLLLLAFVPMLLMAQDLPTPVVGNIFVKPGIRNGSPGRGLSIEYERQPRFNLNGGGWKEQDNGSNEVAYKERFEAKLKFPLLNKEEWKILGDLYHSYERYEFDGIEPSSQYAFGPLDGVRLHRTRLTGYLFKALTERAYLTFRLEASSNGSFHGLVNLDRRYMVYRVAAILGLKRNEDAEMGFGVMFMDNFSRYTAVPILIYNRNFSDKWGLEAILPLRMKLRHNLNDRNILSFGTEYVSSAYSLDLQPPGENAPVPYIFKNSAAQAFLEWETNKLSKWTWFSLKGGYSYNFDSRFILPGTRRDGRIEAFPSSSIFLSAAFFIAPPKDYLEKASLKK